MVINGASILFFPLGFLGFWRFVTVTTSIGQPPCVRLNAVNRSRPLPWSRTISPGNLVATTCPGGRSKPDDGNGAFLSPELTAWQCFFLATDASACSANILRSIIAHPVCCSCHQIKAPITPSTLYRHTAPPALCASSMRLKAPSISCSGK